MGGDGDAGAAVALGERAAEVATLRTAVVTGRGAAVVGVPGIGKTAVARSVVAELEPARFAPVWVAATAASRPVPFGALGGLLGAPDPATDALPFGQQRVARELLRRAAPRTPVLVVDDAHLLDGPSAGAVLGLVTGSPVRVVVTARADGDVPDAVARLWTDGWLPRVDLVELDEAGCAELAGGLLGGAVARPTAEALHQWTGGNPLTLTELVRYGRSSGSLVREGGLWWWRAPLDVPPALAELLDRRLADLDTDARDALAAVALGEPLALDVLDRVVAPAVSARLEDAGLLRTEEAGEQVEVRLDHPLLAAAVRQGMPPSRRRRMAAALLAAAGPVPPAGPRLVSRALWQLEARGAVDVPLLLRASEAALHPDPGLAARFAQRAVEAGGGVAAAVALADAFVEDGQRDRGREVLDRALAGAASPAEALHAAVARAGHRAWAQRDPAGASEELAALAASLPAGDARDEVDAVHALVLLFGARPAAALQLADEVLGRTDRQAATLRAGLARATALTLVGRTGDALAAAEDVRVQAERDASGVPYALGMAIAARALAQLWRTPLGEVPTTDPAHGRWPAAEAVPAGLEPTAWPLFDGYVRRIVGDRPGAIARLREALVQQSGGEGLFRSEAAAWLALSLAEDDRPAEAATVLETHPPDAVAVVPGLLPWARAGVAAARGDVETALREVSAAVVAAQEAGCPLVEVGYLGYEADLRGRDGPAVVADRLAEVVERVDAPRLVASARATIALARDDGPALLDHARRLEEYGVGGAALALAEAATERLVDPVARAEAVAVRDRVRAAIGRSAPPPRVASVLTSREEEIAALAASGLSDREIADRLVLSVRTVESHLSRVYRKLAVTSRHELATR